MKVFLKVVKKLTHRLSTLKDKIIKTPEKIPPHFVKLAILSLVFLYY